MTSTQLQRRPRAERPSSPFGTLLDYSRLPLVLLVAFSMDGTMAFSSLRTPPTALYAAETRTRVPTRLGLQAKSEGVVAQEKASKWWKPFSQPQAEVEITEQARVDDYLEFLERRYQQIHGDGDKVDARFSAWKWLSSGQEEETLQQSEQENALYVLGVAGLASQKLLHKHLHQPALVGESVVTAANVELAESTSVASPSTTNNAMFPVLLARVAPIIRQVTLRRKLLLRYQSRKLKTMAVLLAKSLVEGPVKAGKALWKHGGGKKNVVVTATVVTALCFVLLRPVARTLLSEAA